MFFTFSQYQLEELQNTTKKVVILKENREEIWTSAAGIYVRNLVLYTATIQCL